MKKVGVGLGTSQTPSFKVYPMLSPTQHFIIHSLLVTYFTQGGEGKEGERTCRSTCLTIKSLMNLSCSSLSMPEGIGDTWVLILTKLVWSRCQKTAPVPFHFSKKKIDQSPYVLISHLVNDEQYFNHSILFVESVLIVKDLGIQYTKSCVLGLQTSEFIEHHKIVDVLINEVITMVCLVPDKCNTNCCSLARN